MAPVEELIERPVGRPEAAQVEMVAPDWVVEAEFDWEVMAEPETLALLATDVMATVLLMVQENEADPANPEPSVAVTVTVEVPRVDGVPVIAPAVLIERPAGRPDAVQVSVALAAVSVAVGVTVEMAVPVTFERLAGAVTVTTFTMLQRKISVSV